jgi:F-type H+-transporting ATPase subunit delta
MNELIAKKYVEALRKTFDADSLESVAQTLNALAKAVAQPEIAAVLNAPQVSKEKRVEILSSVVSDEPKLLNLVKLLVEKGRINLIGDIAHVLAKVIADMKKSYTGTVYSNTEIDTQILDELGNGLGKKFDSSISLSYVQNDFDGIKVDVEDLGVEISFSKTRINKQIVEHILKAI